jgi:hypothetical protein
MPDHICTHIRHSGSCTFVVMVGTAIISSAGKGTSPLANSSAALSISTSAISLRLTSRRTVIWP